MDRGLSAEVSAQYGGLAQMPLAGQAMVMAYNLTALSPTDPNIVRYQLILGVKMRSLFVTPIAGGGQGDAGPHLGG